MVEISIVCLIYKSRRLAEALYESVLEYTPKLSSGQAEFFFIANDPTEDVVDFLKSKNIPHYININEHLSDEELFGLGIGTPEYMRRVYQGYNLGLLKAKGQKVALINSDNFFSPDWLENLLKYSDYKKVISSTLIEPGQENFGVFPFAIENNFGHTLDDFSDDKFQQFAKKISKTGYSSGGAYMPCLLYKDVAILAGLYPEGNIAGKSFDVVTRFGDEYFYDRLKEFGVEHITAKDSIVYHLKEGEKSEENDKNILYKAKINKPTRFNNRLVVHPANLLTYVTPEVKHQQVIDELGRKATVLIINPENEDEVLGHLKTVDNFNFKNIDVVLISDNKSIIKQIKNKVKTVYSKDKTDRALYDVFHNMYGEHLLVINKLCEYEKDLFDEVIDRNVIYYFGHELHDDEIINDYMGHFLIPKNILYNNIPSYLEYLLKVDKVKVNFGKWTVAAISNAKFVLPELQEPTPRRRNVAYRAARVLKHRGARGFIRAVKNKVTKK